MTVSIRDAQNSQQDRTWIQAQYPEYLEDLSQQSMNTGMFPARGVAVAAFATDIPELGAWGTPCLFGPGSVHVAHTAHEHVSVRELAAAVESYERLAMA